MKHAIVVAVFSLLGAVAHAENSLSPPPWGNGAKEALWTEVVQDIVHARFNDFDKARESEEFCPGYSAATQEEKENCWLLLVAGVTKFESNYKEATKFREPNGTYSVGLLALSPGECPNAKTLDELLVGNKNLICGTNMMANMIGRAGAIRGAASYWSTLRNRAHYYDRSRGMTLKLGFRAEIIAITKKYRDRIQ